MNSKKSEIPVLPKGVVLVCKGVEVNNELALAQSEAALLSPHATPERRAQFATGRCAAREALAQRGGSGPVLRGALGEPLWPTGFVGSITHTSTLAAAAVARSAEIKSIGIDLEHTTRVVSDSVVERICTEEERHWINLADPSFRALLIFSAKESVFKVLAGLGSRADFKAIVITPQEQKNEGVLHAVIASEKQECAITVRYSIYDAHLLTVAWFET